MRRKRESKDERGSFETTGCPACGNIVRYRKTDEPVLYFQCKQCTSRFSRQNKLPTQTDLEKAYIDSPSDMRHDPPVRVMEVDSDGPAPIRLNRPGSRPRPGSQPDSPGIVHK